MQLTPQQEAAFRQIEARVLCQLLIECLDELKTTSAYRQDLKRKVKPLYELLDKNTKQFDELFNATSEGTTSFYEVMKRNVGLIIGTTLPEKNIINSMVMAYLLDEKATLGIVSKILKAKTKNG